MKLSEDHPTEEVLERYLTEALPEGDAERVEEHLLVCHSCIDSAEQALAFMESLRSAFEYLPKARAAGSQALNE